MCKRCQLTHKLYINGIYDKEVTEFFFEMSRTEQTRGHSKKYKKETAD